MSHAHLTLRHWVGGAGDVNTGHHQKNISNSGNFKAILGNESVLAMAKTAFFSKCSKRWRGFPPDGMFKHV